MFVICVRRGTLCPTTCALELGREIEGGLGVHFFVRKWLQLVGHFWGFIQAFAVDSNVLLFCLFA